MQSSTEINKIAAALAKAQATIQNPTKGKTNPHYQSAYADIADGLKVIRPALSAQGICVVQATEIVGDAIVLRTRLVHRSGQWIGCEWPVGKAGLRQQELAANLTYGKRQALFALVGVAGEDEDTDGEAAADADIHDDIRVEAPEPVAEATAAKAYVARTERMIERLETPEAARSFWEVTSAERAAVFKGEGDPSYKRLRAVFALKLRAVETMGMPPFAPHPINGHRVPPDPRMEH